MVDKFAKTNPTFVPSSLKSCKTQVVQKCNLDFLQDFPNVLKSRVRCWLKY